MDSMERALGNRDNASAALEQLIRNVASHHGLEPSDLLPNIAKASAAEPLMPEFDTYGRRLPEWERRGFASENEMQLALELRATRQMMEELRFGQAQLQKEREDSRKAAEHKAFVDDIAPKAIVKLSKLESGWKVTKAMVEKAITEFPQLRDDPARAVKAAFPDELKQHYAKLSAEKRKARGPEMPADARGRGATMPDPGRFSAKDALVMIES